MHLETHEAYIAPRAFLRALRFFFLNKKLQKLKFLNFNSIQKSVHEDPLCGNATGIFHYYCLFLLWLLISKD